MSAKKMKGAEDRSASVRRKDLSEREIHELELAGGVEGGMRAGHGGGPGESELQPSGKDPRAHPKQ